MLSFLLRFHPGRSLRALAADRRGIVSLFFAGTIALIVLLLLAAVDFMRVAFLYSRLQAALDSAVLAGGRVLGQTDASGSELWMSEAAAYFKANIKQDGMDQGAFGFSYTEPTFTYETGSDNGEYVRSTISATIPLMGKNFLPDLTSITLSVSNKAVRYSRRDVEMALVMDNTGSMANSNKLASMKSAATTLVNTLLVDQPGGNVFIGLVPFNETVRIANDSDDDTANNKTTLISRWLSNASASPYTSSSWAGCMFERKDGGIYTLDTRPPTEAKFTAYGPTTCQYTKKNGQYVWGCSTNSSSQDGCVAAPTVFLSGNASKLKTAISKMEASGSTMVSGGLMWGWRMVSPKWRGANIWGSDTLPTDPKDDRLKVIVLLTDGDNEVTGTSNPNSTKNSYTYLSPYGDAHAVNPYGNLVGKNNVNANALLTDMCKAVKNDGVELYTITFGSSMTSSTKALMQGCASTTANYFHAPDATSLSNAFKSIAGNLSELRLVSD